MRHVWLWHLQPIDPAFSSRDRTCRAALLPPKRENEIPALPQVSSGKEGNILNPPEVPLSTKKHLKSGHNGL